MIFAFNFLRSKVEDDPLQNGWAGSMILCIICWDKPVRDKLTGNVKG
jgi:hypothetical protein